MPPLLQSSSWQGLIRQAGRLIVRAGSKPSKVKSLPRSIRQAVRQTFPSLSTPAHLLELNPAYFQHAERNASSAFSRAAQISRARNSLSQIGSRGFRTNARRPTVPAPVNVGLGSARNYAHGAGPQQMMSSINMNAPIVMRTLAKLVDADIDFETVFSKRMTYIPVDPERLARISIKIAKSGPQFAEHIEKTTREFRRYFPVDPPCTTNVSSSPLVAEESNLLQPDLLVTPGVSSTLTIPLAPSFHTIFELPPSEPYEGSDLGIRRFGHLLGGLLSVHEIIHNRASHFVIPLLDKLDSLGVTFAPSDVVAEREGRCEQFVTYVDIDGYRLPESISIKFHDRSAKDVRAILGESLRAAREGDWWVLTEHRIQHDLSPAESRAVRAEQWENHHPEACRPVDTSQLIMPVMDVDAAEDNTSPSAPATSSSWADLNEWDDTSSPISTPSTLLDETPDSDRSTSALSSPYPASLRSSASVSSFAESLSSQLDQEMVESVLSEAGSVGGRSDIEMSDGHFDADQRGWQTL